MSLRERIDRQIADLDSRIRNIQERATEETAALRRKREALVKVRALITMEIEAAVRALEVVGIELGK